MTVMRSGATGRRRARGSTAVALVLGVLGQVGVACEAPCEQPYRAVAAEDAPGGGPFVEPWPVAGTPRPGVTRPLDTDGDGLAEVAEWADAGTLVVHRSSGDLVLTVPAPATIGGAVPAGDVTVGDLDGDGRSDLVVTSWPEPPTGDDAGTLHVVSGATPDGAHALADVAARPWPAGARLRSAVIGDVDGDGRDDLAGVSRDAPYGVEVWSGADLDLAPGAATPAAPAYAPPGRYEAPLPLSGRDALALQSFDDAGGPVEVLLWVPEATLRFSTEADGMAAPDAMAYVLPEVVGEGADTWMTVTYTYRTIAKRWAWDLDDLCAGA